MAIRKAKLSEMLKPSANIIYFKRMLSRAVVSATPPYRTSHRCRCRENVIVSGRNPGHMTKSSTSTSSPGLTPRLPICPHGARAPAQGTLSTHQSPKEKLSRNHRS